MEISHRKVAEKIYEDFKSKNKFDRSDNDIITNRKDGVKVQEELLRIKKSRDDGAIAGWKVALTNLNMQKLVGINEPAEGAILEHLIYKSGKKLRIKDYCHLGVELEVAIKIKKEIPKNKNLFSSYKDLIPYCGEVMTAFEIVDDRHTAKEGNLGTLLGQNAMNKGCILSEGVLVDLSKLDELEGKILISGHLFEKGSGYNVLGHPMKSLMWLVNSLIGRGRTLVTGDIILTGSIATTYWPLEGDRVSGEIKGLPTINVSVDA